MLTNAEKWAGDGSHTPKFIWQNLWKIPQPKHIMIFIKAVWSLKSCIALKMHYHIKEEEKIIVHQIYLMKVL